MFALFNVVGTKNNLAIRDLVNRAVRARPFAASGATQWGNHEFPWLIGWELVPYPLEVKRFVDYLKENKPDATIAVLEAERRLRAVVRRHTQRAGEGHQLKVVKTEQYDNTGAEVEHAGQQPRGTKADAFFLAAALLACPAALNGGGDAGWQPITYMSGTCVSKVLFASRARRPTGCSPSRRCSTRPIRRTRSIRR